MFLNIFAVFVFLYYVFRGFKKGFIHSILSLCALILGYMAAFYWAKPIGQGFENVGLLAGILAIGAGGMVAFFSVVFLFTIPSKIVTVWVKAKKRKGELTPLYWILGGLVGSVSGIFFAVLVLWVGMLHRASKPALAHSSPTILERATSKIVTFGVKKAMSGKASDKSGIKNLVVKVMAEPEAGVRSLKKLVENPHLENILRSKDFQQTLRQGDSEEVQNHPIFEELFQDKEFLESAEELGMISEEVLLEDFKSEFSGSLIKIHNRVYQIVKDPEIRELLQKPELKKQLEGQDVFALINNPDFNKILDKIYEEPISGVRLHGYITGENWNHYSSGLPPHEMNTPISVTAQPNIKQGFPKTLKQLKTQMFRYNGKRDMADDDSDSLKKLAELGHASAQFRLAMQYANAWGVELDKEKAKSLLQQAAQKNYAEAQFNLSGMYALGWFGKADLEKAIFWLKKAANEGHAQAQYCLGLVYATKSNKKPRDITQTLPQSPERSVDYLQSSSRGGYVPAYLALGLHYAMDEELTQDLTKTYAYLKHSKGDGIEISPEVWEQLLLQMSGKEVAQAKELIKTIQ